MEKNKNKKRKGCKVCRELKREIGVQTSEIYILGAGYYNYNVDIHFCPNCGNFIRYKDCSIK